MASTERPKNIPPQHQGGLPGHEEDMDPRTQSFMGAYRPAGKLRGKVAIVTGGDSGIGRAVSIAFAKEGADLAILYLNEYEDAETTKQAVEAEGRRCMLFAGDIANRDFVNRCVAATVESYGEIDILVNNAGEQHVEADFADIEPSRWERTFRTNVFGMFHLTQAVLPYLKRGSGIVNTTSVTAFRGQPKLIDYSATKGAILAFTRALSLALAEKGIRVNAVAPGPIWTPLIPSTFSPDDVGAFGKHTPMGRPGQPDEVAPAYVFLASDDASYISGQVIHVNGGEIVA